LFAAGFAGGLAVPCGVEGEVAEEFAGGGVHDADVPNRRRRGRHGHP
jgi:hypothetical protein